MNSADRQHVGALGYIAIAVAAAPVAWTTALGEHEATLRVAAWWTTTAGFVATYALSHRVTGTTQIVTLIAHALLALLANWLIPIAIPGVALTGILLVVVAGGIHALPRRIGLLWVSIQTIGLLLIYLEAWPAPIALAAGIAYGAMQFVVYTARNLAALELERRLDIESRLRELESTRDLLSETVAAAERARVARDLHDVMGHHLVALRLHLEAASESETASTHVEEASGIARHLLADVRGIVATVRERPGVRLDTALSTLSTEGPGPSVEVMIDPDLPDLSEPLAEALLRAAQEGVTNARKHAKATRISIHLAADRLSIVDDGRWLGEPHEAAGEGLRGIHERCTALGCTVTIEHGANDGTQLQIAFPAGVPSP
ncbi:MAG: histidine kinase [Planctomycetota bacterium]